MKKMNIKTLERNNTLIAIIQSEEVIITDAQSALDFIMSINYETGSRHIVINKSGISEDFFRLSTGIAGEILQKFINYHMKVAIIGDFSHYTSKPLKDLIYESNRGKDTFFVSTEDEAVEKLASI